MQIYRHWSTSTSDGSADFIVWNLYRYVISKCVIQTGWDILKIIIIASNPCKIFEEILERKCVSWIQCHLKLIRISNTLVYVFSVMKN